jgi:hypothetical protein
MRSRLRAVVLWTFAASVVAHDLPKLSRHYVCRAQTLALVCIISRRLMRSVVLLRAKSSCCACDLSEVNCFRYEWEREHLLIWYPNRPSSKGKPTDPKLREEVKEEVKNETNKDGGGKGQWSAWKVCSI